MAIKQPMIGVHVTPELYARVKLAAKADGRSIASFVRLHMTRVCCMPTARNKRLAIIQQADRS